MAPSRHDWKIVDWDVKPQHNQPTDCRALYSGLQGYIQHYIQIPKVELYIMLSGSIFSTVFNIWILSSILCSPGLYSALYSTFEFWALYSTFKVYIQHCIQQPKV